MLFLFLLGLAGLVILPAGCSSDRSCNQSLIPGAPRIISVEWIGRAEYRVVWTTPQSAPESVQYFSLSVYDENFNSMANYLPIKYSYDVLASEAYVSTNRCALVVGNLRHDMLYQFYVTASSVYGQGPRSEMFPVDTSSFGSPTSEFVVEITLILLSFLGWAILIVIFFRRWGAIKNLQPRETRYKQGAPSGEKDIKVVEKEKDTVIAYKESRASKIAKFKKMRDFRLSQLKAPTFFNLSPDQKKDKKGGSSESVESARSKTDGQTSLA